MDTGRIEWTFGVFPSLLETRDLELSHLSQPQRLSLMTSACSASSSIELPGIYWHLLYLLYVCVVYTYPLLYTNTLLYYSEPCPCLQKP
jgi:hypothetical protein